MQPGSVITPGQNVSPETSPPVDPVPQSIPKQPQPVQLPESQPSAPQQTLADQQEPLQDSELAHWQAADFIDHDKSIGWYGLLALAVLIVAAGLYLITKDLITTFSVVFIAVVFGIVAGMKPRIVEYSIYEGGIAIADKQYNFAQFKSFSILEEDTGVIISLVPLKRFVPYVIVNLVQGQEDQITELISQYLPYQQRNKSVIDTAMHRLRF